MAHRFQFNLKKRRKPDAEVIVVEGRRVDVAGGIITVVDEQGAPKVSLAEAELSSWYAVAEPSR